MPRPKSRTHTKRRKPRTRGLSRYKRSETSRLLKGVIDAGLTPRGLEVDPVSGTLRVLVESGKGTTPDRDTPERIIENL